MTAGRAAIRARWEAVEPGEWTTKPWGNTEPPSVTLAIPGFGHMIMPVELAEAIAHAPKDIAALLADLDAATVEFNAWEEERDRADAEEERAERAEAERDAWKQQYHDACRLNPQVVELPALRARCETAEAVLRFASACQDCGEAHEPRGGNSKRAPSWAADDGHPYRPPGVDTIRAYHAAFLATDTESPKP